MTFNQIAQEISDALSLDRPVIGLSFLENPPTGVGTPNQEAPAACAFWRKAETEVFYAPADAHFNCPIGAMTMGFDMPDRVRQELMSLVTEMVGCGYIEAREAEKIPSVKKKKNGILYGPLEQFPVQPDLVLLWLTPRQAMLLREAAGDSRWTDESPLGVFGRPACAALPMAMERSRPTLSLGCAGMRTFTEISDDRLLAAVPGEELEKVRHALHATLKANQSVQSFYNRQKAKFAQ